MCEGRWEQKRKRRAPASSFRAASWPFSFFPLSSLLYSIFSIRSGCTWLRNSISLASCTSAQVGQQRTLKNSLTALRSIPYFFAISIRTLQCKQVDSRCVPIYCCRQTAAMQKTVALNAQLLPKMLVPGSLLAFMPKRMQGAKCPSMQNVALDPSLQHSCKANSHLPLSREDMFLPSLLCLHPSVCASVHPFSCSGVQVLTNGSAVALAFFKLKSSKKQNSTVVHQNTESC
mmetsp:Transcript_37734/g.97358  ORF Transcript_37734/g.97358 Transcript_37734/m.97358 type:complete len:231 (+) Transcript_37734:100-792(+)